MSSRAALHVWAALGLVSVGCSAPVVDADEVADGGSLTESVVLVERAMASDGSTQTNVSAKFMRMSASADPDLAERVVGSRLDLPSVGECVVLSSGATADDETPALASLGSIELLDVGDVTLRVGSTTMPLAARAFPDVGDLVSGVFYTSSDSASELPAPATYTIEGSGSLLVDRFAVETSAPAGPDDVQIGGASLEGGVVIDDGSSIPIRWRPASDDGASASSDLVYVDVTPTAGAAFVRCAFPDAGEGVVPPTFLRADVLGALPTAATIAIHRVRLGSFVGSGIDFGEVRFDLSLLGRATIGAQR